MSTANAFPAPARAYPEQRKTVGKRAVPASLMGLREIAIKPETLARQRQIALAFSARKLLYRVFKNRRSCSFTGGPRLLALAPTAGLPMVDNRLDECINPRGKNAFTACWVLLATPEDYGSKVEKSFRKVKRDSLPCF